MERVAVLKLPDGKLFGNLKYRVLGDTQGKGWYFVGQNLRSHFRSPFPRSICLGSIPNPTPMKDCSGRALYFHTENAKDFEHYSS